VENMIRDSVFVHCYKYFEEKIARMCI